MNDFERIASEVKDFPTLPVVVARVLRVVDDVGSSANDLVDIIQKDQAIASKVLKVANSAYYGLTQQVRSIGHAVVLLGFDTVRNLCLGVGVLRSFLPYGLHETLDMESFWEHTICAGVCARMLWEERGWSGADEMFLAGLIHDIGRLGFVAKEPRRYSQLLRKARRKGRPMIEAETEEFGGTHAELGARILETWDFGPELYGPARFHHTMDTLEGDETHRTAGVIIGNCLSHQRNIGWAVDARPPVIPEAALAALELTRDEAEKLGDRLENRRTEIESFTSALM